MASSHSLQFYRDRAEQARKEAEAATLLHVKERCRRAEAAWLQLAEKVARTEERRVQHAKPAAGLPLAQ